MRGKCKCYERKKKRAHATVVFRMPLWAVGSGSHQMTQRRIIVFLLAAGGYLPNRNGVGPGLRLN